MGTENTGTSQRVHHGHNIASARRMKGLVQKTLADLLGMSQQRLSQIESTKIVSDEILHRRIARRSENDGGADEYLY